MLPQVFWQFGLCLAWDILPENEGNWALTKGVNRWQCLMGWEWVLPSEPQQILPCSTSLQGGHSEGFHWHSADLPSFWPLSLTKYPTNFRFNPSHTSSYWDSMQRGKMLLCILLKARLQPGPWRRDTLVSPALQHHQLLPGAHCKWRLKSEHLALRAGSGQGTSAQVQPHWGWSLEFLILPQLTQSSESVEVKGGIYMENNSCTAWDNQD